MRVRLQARTLLWQYHLAGFHGSKTPEIGRPATIHTEEPPLAVSTELPPVSTFQKPVAPTPSIGYVSPETPPATSPNVWGATSSPRLLPAQPAAVPMELRSVNAAPTQVRASSPQPLPPGPNKASDSGPKPLPPGPSKAPNIGPKQLPQGPVDTGKPTAEGTFKEPPLAPQKDDGPELP
jgi:hypothetical protein